MELLFAVDLESNSRLAQLSYNIWNVLKIKKSSPSSWDVREKIFLPSSRHTQVDFDLLIEQQNRNLRDSLQLKEIGKGDTEAWKKLNYDERYAIYREGHKTKLVKKKFRWIRNKQPKHVNNNERRENASDSQRLTFRKMQDELAKADDFEQTICPTGWSRHSSTTACKGPNCPNTQLEEVSWEHGMTQFLAACQTYRMVCSGWS